MTDDIKDTQNVLENKKSGPVEKTAGQMLREARTTGRRKREIVTIAKQLCIREEFLQALEDGDYAALPETVYILGFARNYAMELGINPDEIVEKIKKELGVEQENSVQEEETPVQIDISNVSQKETIKKGFSKIKDSKFCKFIKQHWRWFVGGIAALVIVGVLLLIFLPSDSDHTEAEAVITQTTVVEPEYKVAVRERFGTENRNDAEIILQIIQESWIKIEDARGKVVFSKVLMPGDVYYVPNGNKNKATFGNVGGVDVWVRGELISKLGAEHTRKNGILLDADELLKSSQSHKN